MEFTYAPPAISESEDTNCVKYRISANGDIMHAVAGKKVSFPLLRKYQVGKNILDIIPHSKWIAFRDAVNMLHSDQQSSFKFLLVCDNEKYWYKAVLSRADNYDMSVHIHSLDKTTANQTA
jgi:hypothetical protein